MQDRPGPLTLLRLFSAARKRDVGILNDSVGASPRQLYALMSMNLHEGFSTFSIPVGRRHDRFSCMRF